MARPKKPETPVDPLVSVRSIYYEFLKHLDTTKVDLKAAVELIKKINKHKNSEKLWAGVAQYRDLRGKKALLMHAVHASCRPLFDALLKAGGDVNVVDKVGRTLGHYAASGNNPWFAALVVSEYPTTHLLYTQDDYGQRPVDLALSLNNREFLRGFEAVDKEVSKRSEPLVNLLLNAVKHHERDCVSALQAVLRQITPRTPQ